MIKQAHPHLQLKRETGIPVKHAFWLLLICLVGYWPLSTGLFSLKNDAFVYFLPNRFMASDAIRQGMLPYWSPYFYMGYPLHGDMQSGVWNPVVWIFSAISTYNMYSLHAETLLYMFLSGVGLYKLLGTGNHHAYTKLALAVGFMFSGFIIDTAQITVWTASAAGIPFVLLYFHRLLFEPVRRLGNACKTALALYFLFSAGYPSFLIMTAYIMAGMTLFGLFNQHTLRQGIHETWKTFPFIIIAGAGFIILSLPALLSYLDYLPNYQRASGLSIGQAQENPFTWFGLISAVFPLSVTRSHEWLMNNPTARSIFAGLFSVMMLAGWYRIRPAKTTWWIISGTLFFLLFSIGDAGPVRKLCYEYLPGMNLFRHPGTMRVFVTVGLLLLAAKPLDAFWSNISSGNTALYKKTAIAFIGIIVLFLLFNLNGSKTAVVNQSAESWRDQIKQAYDALSFQQALWLDGILQLFFLAIFLQLLRSGKPIKSRSLLMLFILNSVICAQATIPYTIVSRVSTRDINAFIDQSPKGYPCPSGSIPIAVNNKKESSYNRAYASASVYLKQIAWVNEVVNPSHHKLLFDLAAADSLRRRIFSYPPYYMADTAYRYSDSLLAIPSSQKILFADDVPGLKKNDQEGHASPGYVQCSGFSNRSCSFQTNATAPAYLLLTQVYSKNWKAFIGHREVKIYRANMAFMCVMVPPGKQHVKFLYEPAYLAWSIPVALGGLLVLLGCLYYDRRKALK